MHTTLVQYCMAWWTPSTPSAWCWRSLYIRFPLRCAETHPPLPLPFFQYAREWESYANFPAFNDDGVGVIEWEFAVFRKAFAGIKIRFARFIQFKERPLKPKQSHHTFPCKKDHRFHDNMPSEWYALPFQAYLALIILYPWDGLSSQGKSSSSP